MRYFVPIIALTLLAACKPPQSSTTSVAARPAPTYAPETFRQSISAYIAAKDYASATALVRAADVSRQSAYDRTGYLAIGGDKVYLPGAGQSMEYDPRRDWYIPGTSDAVEDSTWQSVATGFADRYNCRR